MAADVWRPTGRRDVPGRSESRTTDLRVPKQASISRLPPRNVGHTHPGCSDFDCSTAWQYGGIELRKVRSRQPACRADPAAGPCDNSCVPGPFIERNHGDCCPPQVETCHGRHSSHVLSRELTERRWCLYSARFRIPDMTKAVARCSATKQDRPLQVPLPPISVVTLGLCAG